MAKLSKRIRKGTRRVAQSEFVRDVLEDLVKAALLAAAAKLADSAAADRAKRSAERLIKRPSSGGGSKTGATAKAKTKAR
jgi:hypothetical protein